jgi:hypothetical protein
MASSSTGLDDIRTALLNFSRVGWGLLKHGERQLQQLVEVLKHHMREKVFTLLRAASDEAVLFSYSADATPLRLSTTATHSSSSSSQVVRKGRNLEDLLLQRGLFKTIRPSGEPELAFLFTDILSMTEGKNPPTSSQHKHSSSHCFAKPVTKGSVSNMCAQTGPCLLP